MSEGHDCFCSTLVSHITWVTHRKGCRKSFVVILGHSKELTYHKAESPSQATRNGFQELPICKSVQGTNLLTKQVTVTGGCGQRVHHSEGFCLDVMETQHHLAQTQERTFRFAYVGSSQNQRENRRTQDQFPQRQVKNSLSSD